MVGARCDRKKNYLPDVDGFEHVTVALMEMVNNFPGLEDGEVFKFSTIPNEDGLSVIAQSGSFIVDERESITGHVWQTCAYPFMIVNRVSGLNQNRKISTKEWMDALAKWMIREPVKIRSSEYQMKKWPKLTGKREIRLIRRDTPAYLGSINEDKSENWIMNLTIQYRNEFDR